MWSSFLATEHLLATPVAGCKCGCSKATFVCGEGQLSRDGELEKDDLSRQRVATAAATINFPGRRGKTGAAEDIKDVGQHVASHTRPGLFTPGPSTDDRLDTAEANIDVGSLRVPKVGLKLCIVPINSHMEKFFLDRALPPMRQFAFLVQA